MLAKTNLIVTAAVFLGFGLWALVAPQHAAAGLGLTIANGDGVVAVRAMYGGYLVGAGLLFATAALDARATRYGSLAIVLIVGPILLSRLLGMALDRPASLAHLWRAALEAGSLVLTTLLLLSRKSVSKDQSPPRIAA